MAPDALEILRRVNGTLRSKTVLLRPDRRHCSTLHPQDLSEVISQVLQASECLRRIHSGPTIINREEDLIEREAIEKEVFEYSRHLEDLKHCLPDLHVRLLAERARLETARSHLSAASAWAGARKEML